MSLGYASDDIRARKVRLAKAIKEKQLRDERKRQSDLGEPGRPGGLIHFVRYFWHVLEPATPFVEGWVIEAICQHLEAVTRGEIKRLLINVPPGFAKSMLVNVFHPAWEWSAAGLPHLRYVTFAYASHLTERDNGRFRDVLQSAEFREMWGHVFKLTANGVIKPSNDARGWKFSSSIDGIGTGERGNRILCLPGDELILTDRGWLPIGSVVDRRLDVRVAGYDHAAGRIEWQSIEAYERNPGQEIYEVESEAGSFRCTGDHPVYIQGRGYARADSLKGGEQLVWSGGDVPVHALQRGVPAQAEPSTEVLQQALPYRGGQEGCAGAEQPAVRRVREDGLSPASAPQEDARALVLQPRVPRQVECGGKQPGLHRSADGDLRAVRKAVREAHAIERVLFSEVRRRDDQSAHAGGMERASELSAMRGGVHSESQGAAVLHAGMRGCGSLTPDCGQGEWPLRARGGSASLPARLDQDVQGADQGARWGLLPAMREPTRAAPRAGCAPHRLRQEQSGNEQPDYALSILPREDARPEIAARKVETRTVRSVRKVGRDDVVFNVRVAPHHNYFAGGFLVHNCDDIHNVREGESEKVRGGTVQWVREGMSNRLNDMQEDVIIGIGQRVHENDASAAMLDDGDYVHLCVPMVYDSSRHCTTVIGWEDPRVEDGELAWPERFPARVVKKLQQTLGPYAFSAQYQQSPTPRGGGLIKEAWWQVHQVIKKETGGYRFVPDIEPIFVLASLDTAFSEKETNDYSAMTVWAVYEDKITKRRKILLVDGWKKRLSELHGETVEREDGETDAAYNRRANKKWGLVEWVNHTCRIRKVNRLVVENKTRGHDVVKELRRIAMNRDWGLVLVNPKGDKTSRGHSVVHMFTDDMIHAPALIADDGTVTFLEWADMVIQDTARFPHGSHDDVYDTVTQGLRHLRESDLAVLRDEARSEAEDMARHKGGGDRQALYPA